MALPKRKLNRLSGYDYSTCGAYFITICTQNRENLFWETVGATFGRPNDTEYLSKNGYIVDAEIKKIRKIYNDTVAVDKYVIMPNHIHMIIVLQKDGGRPKVAPTISCVIQQFKGSITKQIGFSPWQKLFHDHVIRNEHDYEAVWQYIDENPLKWKNDCYYEP
mgnify:CR=1 FL=1